MSCRTGWEIKSSNTMQGVIARAKEEFLLMNAAEELESTAAFFKALGDETRLKIMTLLWFEDLCMCEIVDGLSGASSTISHHLKIMEKGKLIQSRKEGKFTVYSLDKERLAPLIPYIKEGDLHV
ncbi:metalloregulator ArsR/SmtB family transcription factor [Mesobacillus jeotgali]|jgi:ArsR family transcriptional regulator, lead/cadmium/zinc/bismuth-responsive transcriptional repressor|uniref:Metalloregulator ArsR/SmtB family transcription factor n=1 Tax=Mesobacillus jeotgali TaxID=129985 RepID=A0ABY9VIZ0_9BACI|nr:metalloregulator ArsR/SmtB family transcription factor [Mesobacillus jeotgali]WNF23625.1 metalloregulator ArsR/SmtB family transcription factor [Mesobacillus jeotgali]